MRKLLSSPVNMALTSSENLIYQTALKYAAELSLNLMATKVTQRPDDFLSWCRELLRLLREELNIELLDSEQLPPFKKLQDTLINGITISQLKMLRIAPWPIYCEFIQQQSGIHALSERLRLLSYIQSLSNTPLAEMTEEDRLAYAGKHINLHDPSVYDFDAEWFASTKSAKVFHILLKEQPQAFDQALSHIPLEGTITVQQYQNFSKAYQAIFNAYTVDKPQGEKAPLAPATRLLAMRRPDQFIALNNNKIDNICQGLSIAKINNYDFDGYWKELITSLRASAWWLQSCPDNDDETKLWQARMILADMFLFADESTAERSNYLRIKNKKLNPANRSSTRSNTTKRTKASAEALVDKALSADDMPDYLQEKRDSIVKQVKEGKSVDHVIGLMRAIFG